MKKTHEGEEDVWTIAKLMKTHNEALETDDERLSSSRKFENILDLERERLAIQFGPYNNPDRNIQKAPTILQTSHMESQRFATFTNVDAEKLLRE